MALTSPRFRRNRTLKGLESGRQVMKRGDSGRAVHLVQFALIDLGFPMPRSTGGQRWSPDASFGGETEEAVIKFQRRNRLATDGKVGQKTMRALDRAAGRYTHRVTLHFISISLTNVSFEKFMSKAREAFDQYAIKLVFGSGQSLLLSDAETAMFDKIDQNCNWNLSNGEYAQLHALGRPVPSSEVTVYFVNRMRGVVGCGGHLRGRPAATVARAAGAVDVGHELGHVLLTSTFRPVHHAHNRNIMCATGGNERWTWVMSHAQIVKMRSHPCCRAI